MQFRNQTPGLCTGLSIKVDDLGGKLSKGEYPFLCALHGKGVAGLLEQAKESFGVEPARDAYVSKCELCIELRGRLAIEKEVRSKDLNPVEYYSN